MFNSENEFRRLESGIRKLEAQSAEQKYGGNEAWCSKRASSKADYTLRRHAT
jgi:hypothetical protein